MSRRSAAAVALASLVPGACDEAPPRVFDPFAAEEGSAEIPAPGWEAPAAGTAPDLQGWMPAAPEDPLAYDPKAAEDATLLTMFVGKVSITLPKRLEDPDPRPWTSGAALAFHEGEIFALDREGGTLAVLGRGTGKVLRSVDAGPRPIDLVVGPDGAAFVTISGAGEVGRIDPGSDRIDLRAPAGIEPSGLALSPDGDLVFVVSAGEGTLRTYDAGTLTLLSETLPWLSRPRAVAATDDLVVVAQRGSGALTFLRDPSTGLPADVPTWTDLRTSTGLSALEGTPRRPRGSEALAVHPETGEVYVAHDLAIDEGGSPEGSDMSGGGYGGGSASLPLPPVEATVTPIVGGPPARVEGSFDFGAAGVVLDPLTGRVVHHLLRGPSGVAHHPTLGLLFVTGLTSDTVLVLNTNAPDPATASVAVIQVGAAPTAVAFDEEGLVAYVLASGSFTVGRVDLAPLFELLEPGPHSSLALHLFLDDEAAFAVDPLPPEARLGRRVFHHAFNPRLSEKGHFACATCHPGGLEDQHVWPVDGVPRQTPALAGRLADTAPYNWLGTEHVLQDNMSETIERMGGTGLTADELASLESYLLHGLHGPPNPHVPPGGAALTESQARGKLLFESPEVGCASCHVPGPLTDGFLHDVGTGALLNTPSLRGLFHTAPYLHDGSAGTLDDVLYRTAKTMGRTDSLSWNERADLIAYLLTL